MTTVTEKSEKTGDFERVRNGESQSIERDSHRVGVLEALQGYHRGRRISHRVLGKGSLQKYQRRRRRKGREKAVKRQGEDKLTAKVAFLSIKTTKAN